MPGGMRYADQSQLNFFSLLLPAGLVSGHSLLSLYQSMLSVLTELGGGGDRAERVIRAVGEGLLRVSHQFSICPGRRSDKTERPEPTGSIPRGGRWLDRQY